MTDVARRDYTRPRATLRDVARTAGVSIGTASNVLNAPTKVAPDTLTRVRAAIDTLGFSRNDTARALASGTTNTIGLIVPTLRNSLFVDIAEGAQHAAEAAGLRLQLTSANSDAHLRDDDVDFLIGGRVEGLLLAPMTDSSLEIGRLRRHRVPVVLVNYGAPASEACSVMVDNEAAGYLAATHLIGLGRRHIALIGGRYDLQPIVLRRHGVLTAIARGGHGLQLQEFDTGGIEESDGRTVAEMLARRAPYERPDAVIGLTDMLAASTAAVLMQNRLRVPDDVAVIGCDHNAAAWGGPIPLTTIAMRGEQMGAEGVRLLDDERRGQADHVHRSVLLESALIARESTIGR